MANKKLTDLPELTTTPAADDFLYIVDKSDLTESGEGTSKKIRVDKLANGSDPLKEDKSNKLSTYTVDGTGEKYYNADYVNAALDVLNSQISPSNYVVTDTGYSQLLNVVTVNAGWEWKINNVDYTNPALVNITVPYAASGYERIDLIVLNESNTAVRVVGEASNTVPVSPVVPINTIQIAIVTTDSTTSSPIFVKPKNQVSQFIRNGETSLSPSEDVLFDALAGKQNQLTEGTNITIDVTDPLNPVISSMGGGSYTVNQTPDNGTYALLTGEVNDSNTLFTVNGGKYITGSLVIYKNGQLMTQGATNDFLETTPALGTFSFVTAPITGDIITAIFNSSSVVVGGGVTNLAYIATPTDGTVTSDTGTNATLPLADVTNAGLLKPAKFTVLENTSGTNTGDQDLSGLALKAIQVTAQTLTAGSWTLVSGLYEYNLANANITTTSIVDVIPDNAYISIVQVAQVLPKTLSGSGTVKLYSTNLPTGNIVVTINIWK